QLQCRGVANGHAQLPAPAVQPASGDEPAADKGVEIRAVEMDQIGAWDTDGHAAGEVEPHRLAGAPDPLHHPFDEAKSLRRTRQGTAVDGAVGGQPPPPAPGAARLPLRQAVTGGVPKIGRNGEMDAEPLAEEPRGHALA